MSSASGGEPGSDEGLRFRAGLLDRMEDAIVVTDPEWLVSLWNRGAERLYGWSAAKALGRHVASVARLGAGEHEQEQMRRATHESGRWRGDVTAYRKNGGAVDVDLLMLTLRGRRGELTGFLGIHHQIAKRWHGERRLAYHALLLESMEDAVLATDEQFVLTGWNKGAQRMFGWTAEEAVGRRVDELIPTSLSEIELAAEMRGLVRMGRWRGEASWYGKNRAPVYAEGLTVALPPGATGKGGGYLCIMRDLTERQRERDELENRLDQARESERRRVARDLHDEALLELSGALAQAMVARSTAVTSAEERRWSAQIEAIARVAGLVRSSIYDLRLSASEDREFGGLLAELVGVQGAIGAGIEVELEGEESLPAGTLGHRGTEVLRIVREAITNARRHAGAGSVRVVAGASTRELLRLEVIDDGTWAAETPAGSTGAGTGIAAMRERAEALGAELQIEDGARGGTVVRLELALGDRR